MSIIFFIIHFLFLPNVNSLILNKINYFNNFNLRPKLYNNLSLNRKVKTSPLHATTSFGNSDNKIDNVIGVIGDKALEMASDFAQLLSSDTSEAKKTVRMDSKSVNAALIKIQKDMNILDEVAGQTPQLTRLELAILMTTVAVSASAPSVFSLRVVEVLVPSMAAVAAALGISAEYSGKVAVSNGKEVAAVAIQAAAEAECILAAAERTKAVIPFCVGIATTASAFSLLAPALVAEISFRYGINLIEEVYFVCPLIAVVAAAVAGLAQQECTSQASRAAGIGNRRFASSRLVSRSWLSATEQIEKNSERAGMKWNSFSGTFVFAPLLGVLCPGGIPFKAIVVAAVAAAQAAYYITMAEYSVAQAVTAVSLKARTAAVADTYANQGSRAGAVLPFTSALAGLCAAASAATVELLPLINFIEIHNLVAVFFPTGAAMFAAAASVSKARCQVDATAASVAVSSLITDDEDEQTPVDNVIELLRLTARTTSRRVKLRMKRFTTFTLKQVNKVVSALTIFLNKTGLRKNDGNNNNNNKRSGNNSSEFQELPIVP